MVGRVCHGMREQMRRVASRLLGEANENIVRGAKLLQRKIAEIELRNDRAHLGKIGSAGFLLNLHDGTTAKVDPKIEARVEVKDDGHD